tara:strand:+ start:5571 stop:6266 length:696 start_codon:yes stop_codon:yes gene_type:complete
MIHYHGTPFTPKLERQKMAGKHMCVSFADHRDDDWSLTHAQSVMHDNGAFSFYTKQKHTDWDGYYQWLEPRLGHPHWAVVPDVIGGSVEQNLGLIKQWPHRKDLAGVVWHVDEPVEHLLSLTEGGWGKVCFGSSGQYWQVLSENWCRRMDLVFNVLAKNGPIPWVHMLRGLDTKGEHWPFASADSVNVAINYAQMQVCPERMARKIDAIQTPVHWNLRLTQNDLFATGGSL